MADLARVNRLKTAGQLAATMAHELNQPLAAISFQSEVAGRLLEINGHTDRQLIEALKEVTDQSHRTILLEHRALLEQFAQEHHDPLATAMLADNVKPRSFPSTPPKKSRPKRNR